MNIEHLSMHVQEWLGDRYRGDITEEISADLLNSGYYLSMYISYLSILSIYLSGYLSIYLSNLSTYLYLYKSDWGIVSEEVSSSFLELGLKLLAMSTPGEKHIYKRLKEQIQNYNFIKPSIK